MSNIQGTLTRAGTFRLGDGIEVTGYVIECTRQEMENVESLPIYRSVSVVPFFAGYNFEKIRVAFDTVDRHATLSECEEFVGVRRDELDALKAAIMEAMQ